MVFFWQNRLNAVLMKSYRQLTSINDEDMSDTWTLKINLVQIYSEIDLTKFSGTYSLISMLSIA